MTKESRGAVEMSNHQATEQMLGYLYQVRYALALLLENSDPNCQISIEKFDDVAFGKDSEPIQLIQLKHHIKKQGNLTDNSTDLWRTLKVWIDAITQKPDILRETEFLIITTAIAPENEASSYLKRDDNRDTATAYEKLKKVCTQSKNKDHQKYYQAFIKLDEATMKQLFERIYILDGASNIVGVEQTIRRNIRYSSIPKYEKFIFERLEGWWFQKAVNALCSDQPIFVTQNQVRAFIVTISQEYSDENLPIVDIFNLDDLKESDLSENEKIFYEQLKLICLSSHHMRIALRDYYRAFQQRASWIRNELLYVDDLEKYEIRLVDEWEHFYAEMEDDLTLSGTTSEEEKIRAGRKLLSDIEKQDIRIRPKCQEAFIMRGSYHMLANKLKVGWHIDFYTRLKSLLDT